MTAKGNKKYHVAPASYASYDTYEEAETAAKKKAGNNRGSDYFYIYGLDGDYGIFELVAVAEQPIPDVKVTAVK